MKPYFKKFTIVVAMVFSVQLFLYPQSKQKTSNIEERLNKTMGTISFIQNKELEKTGVLFNGKTAVGNMTFTQSTLHFFTSNPTQKVETGKTRPTQHWGVRFLGANAHPEARFEKNKNTPITYVNSNSKSSELNLFEEVFIENLYQGISLRLYSKNNKSLEFDWIVAVGANLADIKMQFEGTEGISLSTSGELITNLKIEEVNFHAPISYQFINKKRIPVTVNYEINNGLVSLVAPNGYDKSQELIVDPILRWGTFFDGMINHFDWDGYVLATDFDQKLNVYIAGWYDSRIYSNYVNYKWGYDSVFHSDQDGLVIKFNDLATKILHITIFGDATGYDRFHALDVSPDGTRIFLGGATSMTTLPAGTAAAQFDNSMGGTHDALVVVFDSTLTSLLYSTYIGSSSNSFEYINTIKCTSNTDFVISGVVTDALSAAYINNAADATFSGASGTAEGYIARFTGLNTLSWGTYLGGDGDDILNDFQYSSTNEIIFCGWSNQTTNFPTLVNGVSSAANYGQNDGFVGVIPFAGGSTTMLSRIGGSDDDKIIGMVLGKNDTIFFTGSTKSSNYDLGPAASASTVFQFNRADINWSDGILGKLPKTGKTGSTDPYIGTFFGGGGGDIGNSIQLFQNKAVMIFGSTQSGYLASSANGSAPSNFLMPEFPCKNTAFGGTFYDSTNNGSLDICFIALDFDLKSNYFGTYVGGVNRDYLGESGYSYGSNQFKNIGDSIGLVTTTVHSQWFSPDIIGPRTGSKAIFDSIKAGSAFGGTGPYGMDDSYIIFEWYLNKPNGLIPEVKASLGDFIWLDADKDGVQDAGEPGLSDVVVELFYDYNNDGDLNDAYENIAYRSTKTNALGIYSFTNLTAGNYQIKVYKPTNYVFSSQTNTIDNTDGTATKDKGSDVNPATGLSYVFNLIGGENEANLDAGLKIEGPTSSSIGDKVWYDRNSDGKQDANEEGIAGVLVTLYDPSGNAIAVVTTDVNGNYLFDNVAPGIGYRVGFTQPPGFVFSTKNASGTTVDNDSDPNTSGVNFGKSDPITVVPNTAITNIDCGLKLQSAANISIGDFVWNDLNRDGLQTAGEPGMGGVKIYLTDQAGTTILDSTITAANGYYIFNDKPTGIYRLKVAAPAGYTITPSTVGTNGFIDNDFNPGNNGFTAALNLDIPGTRYMEIDAGLYKSAAPSTLASLGDKVWMDKNYNGAQDPSEPGVAGVTVTLLDNSGNPIDNDPSKPGVQPYIVVTDDNGNYLFTDLPAGTYKVKFSNFPAGTVIGTKNASGNINTDSDADPNTGISDAVTLVGGTTNNTVDCGLTQGIPSGLGSLGSLVWNDVNNDGLKQASEAGFPNIKVRLFNAGPDGIKGNSDDVLMDSIYTNSIGEFIFTGLPANKYYVEFSNIPSGYAASPQNAGTDNTIDSDGSPISGGKSTSDLVTLPKGQDDLSTFLGLYSSTKNSFGDLIWYDVNNDGQQTAGEPGVAGVQLVLCNVDGSIYDMDPGTAGIQQYAVTSNKNGYFQFTNLQDGSYKYKVVDIPSGFTVSPSFLGGNPAADSDVDPVTKISDTVILNAGNRLDVNLDLGLQSTTNIILGDFVWNDLNGNGIQDAGEPGIPGVTVIVYDATGTNPIASCITDGNGKYIFTGLIPGTYVVKFSTAPSGINPTLKDQTAEPLNTDSDIGNNGATDPITLVAKDVNLKVDAGYSNVILASVGDYVWQDFNSNGTQDAGEAGVNGVIVSLYSPGPDNNPGNADDVIIGSAVTSSGGFYKINNVPPGNNYYVTFGNKPNGDFTTQNVGGTGATNNSKSNTTGTSTAFTIPANTFVQNIDAGLINLITLSAKKVTLNLNTKSHSLNWIITEPATGVFTIYAKANNLSAFVAIGTITATDNNKNYSFALNGNESNCNCQYYVELIETAGNKVKSNIVVNSINNSQAQGLQVSPNPAQDVIQVSFYQLENAHTQLSIVDLQGKILFSKKFENSNSGQLTIEKLNITMLSSGMYYVVLIQNGEKTVLKLTK